MQAETHPTRIAPNLTREIRSNIGQQLRAVYDDVIKQGIPERFVDLLDRLDQGDGPHPDPATRSHP